MRVKEFQIKNFKAFGELVRIPIKPITLIFGPNSSGKSSILHALRMIKQSKDMEHHGLRDHSLTTHSEDMNLGLFDNVLNKKSTDGLSFRFTFDTTDFDIFITKSFTTDIDTTKKPTDGEVTPPEYVDEKHVAQPRRMTVKPVATAARLTDEKRRELYMFVKWHAYFSKIKAYNLDRGLIYEPIT